MLLSGYPTKKGVDQIVTSSRRYPHTRILNIQKSTPTNWCVVCIFLRMLKKNGEFFCLEIKQITVFILYN